MIIVYGDSDFYILLGISIIVIILVLTFNVGKDSDTIEFHNGTKCNEIYSSMYEYCQFGSVYSEILLWGLFSTYCIQTKELQLIFPILISLMTIACTTWSTIITIRLISDNYYCLKIVYDYDYLSIAMHITNTILLNLILIGGLIFGIIYKLKTRKKIDKEILMNDMV